MTTEKKTPTDYLKLPYTRVIVPEPTGGFTAHVLELPGCIAEGDTSEEAAAALERAAESWLAVALDLGQVIPEPTGCGTYSGKFPLRLPTGLHERLALVARMNDVSLNQFIVAALAEKAGMKAAADRLVEVVRDLVLQMTHKAEESGRAVSEITRAAVTISKDVARLRYGTGQAETADPSSRAELVTFQSSVN